MSMDHQMLTGSNGNHAWGWDLPADMVEEFEKTKVEKGWRINYQDDYVQYEKGRRFGHCSYQRQQHALQCSKRSPRKSSSGMQAVFLQGSRPHSHSTKGSVGTGVFLPPGAGNVEEPTKKSGCSTVLLPAGVIQALKLHFDRVDQQSLWNANAKPCPCFHRSRTDNGELNRMVFTPADVMITNRNGYDNAKQRRRFLIAAELWSQDSNSHEGLPREWSY